MSLEKLVQLGWYQAEPSTCSYQEIADFFSIVDRPRADSKVLSAIMISYTD